MSREHERIPEIDGLYHVCRRAYGRVFLGVGSSYREALYNMAMAMGRHEAELENQQ